MQINADAVCLVRTQFQHLNYRLQERVGFAQIDDDTADVCGPESVRLGIRRKRILLALTVLHEQHDQLIPWRNRGLDDVKPMPILAKATAWFAGKNGGTSTSSSNS